ncbi:probable cysteine--tRNA ligase, mitochondrial isoform X2 [Symsagittifera roscoffensis]
MGVTDVDDKIIKKAKDSGKRETEVAAKYELQFFNALEKLNVRRPDVILRVSDYIPKIIDFIQSLIEKKYAYVTPSGNVFFDSQSFPKEGKFDPVVLSKQSEQREEIMQRSPTKFHPEKKNRADFALWKSRISDEVSWPCPWGEGRPGWHIECSSFCDVISGGMPHLTIHSGGVDLKFPHHNNEICQSEAFYETDSWVKVFMHIGAMVDSETGLKMSKSLQNFISVDDFLDSHGTSDELRVTCLRRSYRSTLPYSKDDLNLSRHFLIRVAETLDFCDQQMKSCTGCGDGVESNLDFIEKSSWKFGRAICDDFDFPSGLEVISSFCDSIRGRNLQMTDAVLAKQFLISTLNLMGIEMSSEVEQSASERALLEELTRFRNVVREFSLGKTNRDGRKLSKSEMKQLAAENEPLLAECDNVRSFINDLSLKNMNDSD